MKVLDLFSGCGGLSLGFEAAGFSVVDAVDLDATAIETFELNHNNTQTHCLDVATFLENYNRQVDVVIGGPPCQGFSSINPSRKLSDPRNSGIDYFLRAVDQIRPRFFVMENVTGLLSLGKGQAFNSLTNEIQKLGYQFDFKVLQAAHYGVPQSRWRLIILGAKSELRKPTFPIPTHSAKITPNFSGGYSNCFRTEKNDLFLSVPTTVWDAISDLPPVKNGESYDGQHSNLPQSEYQNSLRCELAQLKNHASNSLGYLQMQRVEAIRNEGENWKVLPLDLMPDNLKRMHAKYGDGLGCNQRFGRLRKDGLFSTILTSPHLYWGAFIHPVQDRVISVREAARAQSFPDKFEFKGSIGKQYTQVGNAVPPILARKIAECIRE